MPTSTPTMEQLARMGEQVVSSAAGDVLTCIGLGSCIGLALIDWRAGVAGLAHIMLPEAPSAAEPSGKHADFAVPELLQAVTELGAARHRLEAVMVGGAAMFSFTKGAGQEIGRRNEDAVTKLLADLRIPVRASATGGDRGRTMRVRVTDGRVLVRAAGSQDEVLFAGGAESGSLPFTRSPDFGRAA